MNEKHLSIIEGHEHIVSDSELQSDLYELYLAQTLEAVQESAAKIATDSLPRISRLISDKEFPGSLGAGSRKSAYSRMEHKLLNNAAKKQGVAVSYGEALPDDENSHLIWEYREGGGVSFRYRDNDGRLYEQTRNDEDELGSPMVEISEKLRAGEVTAVSKEYFALDEMSQDQVITFMRMDPGELNPYRAKAAFLERLYELPVRLVGEQRQETEDLSGVYFNEDGDLVKVLHEVRKGISVGMFFDDRTTVGPSDTTFRLGVEVNTQKAILEHGFNEGALSEPFIKTETGKSFVGTLEESGLQPSSELVELLAGRSSPEGIYDVRYGNRYSELTRTIAKFVGNQRRSLEGLFEGDDGSVRARLMEIDVNSIENPPVQAALSILQQSVNPNRDVSESNIPVFDGVIKIRSDSCKDAEAYFLDSLKSNDVSYHETSGGFMLHKHVGGKTALNLNPVIYKGVEIPAGGLFQRHKNPETGIEEYAFVRLTSFVFDEQSAEDAFGWQYLEATGGKNQASAELLEKVKQVNQN